MDVIAVQATCVFDPLTDLISSCLRAQRYCVPSLRVGPSIKVSSGLVCLGFLVATDLDTIVC
jgi:hypothetical protein